MIRTINLPDAVNGGIIPVSVSRLPDGTYALIVDERSIHNLGVGGAAVVTADASLGVPVTDAPTGGQHIVVDEIIISTGTPNLTVDFIEETTNTILFHLFLTNNGAINPIGNDRVKLPTADKRLFMKASAAGALGCTVFWYSEP